MNGNMYIQIAPFHLKDGVDEKALLDGSDNFQSGFVARQKGVLKRILVKSRHGGYADLVFFENKEAADRIAAAEESSREFGDFLGIMKAPDGNPPDMGVLSFEHLKTYE